MGESAIDRQWWKEAVVYQIYPRSFNDSDGDGIGDIPGIVRKVDYIDALGVDVVWLNPVYASPQADNGYDIADYRAIHPEYGAMDDWERLLDALHDRGIRLIMDLVVNHTSDEHDWFVRSREGEEPYDDYYYWRSGSEGEGPPNNWESFFGGPAWSYDRERGEYYLHLFDEKQPDLDWTNEDVRDDVYEMMTWWLEKGIDGFRMDVINLISKREGLPDGDPADEQTGVEHYINGPRLHEYLGEMNDRVLSNYDLMTVGETVGVSPEEAREFVGEGIGAFDMVIHFEHMDVDRGETKWEPVDLHLPDLKDVVRRWQETLHPEGWNCLYLSNHDQPRAVSRFGDDERYRVESAKLLGTLLFTLRGTPFVYQGQEIGMTNAPFPDRSTLRDVWAHNFVDEAKEAGRSYEEVRDLLETCSRDNSRTPMQWSDRENAGFTDGEPWMHVNPNYPDINVERALADENSVLNYYRELIALREAEDVLIYGSYEPHHPDHESLWVYERALDDERALVVLNVDDDPTEFAAPDAVAYQAEELLIANYPADDRDPGFEDLRLRPYEARVYRLA